jgi:hypothetical protein
LSSDSPRTSLPYPRILSGNLIRELRQKEKSSNLTGAQSWYMTELGLEASCSTHLSLCGFCCSGCASCLSQSLFLVTVSFVFASSPWCEHNKGWINAVSLLHPLIQCQHSTPWGHFSHGNTTKPFYGLGFPRTGPHIKIFFLPVLGVKLRAFHLLGRLFTTWVTLPALFAFAIFKIGSHFMPRPAVLPWIAGVTRAHHTTMSSQWLRWGFMNFFCLCWTWTVILLISISRVARIIGMSHHTQAKKCIFLS